MHPVSVSIFQIIIGLELGHRDVNQFGFKGLILDGNKLFDFLTVLILGGNNLHDVASDFLILVAVTVVVAIALAVMIMTFAVALTTATVTAFNGFGQDGIFFTIVEEIIQYFQRNLVIIFIRDRDEIEFFILVHRNHPFFSRIFGSPDAWRMPSS